MNKFFRFVNKYPRGSQVGLWILLVVGVLIIGNQLSRVGDNVDRCPEYWEFKELSIDGHIVRKYERRGPMIDIEYSGGEYGVAPGWQVYNQVHNGDSVRKEKGKLDLMVIRKDTSFVLFSIGYSKECEGRLLRQSSQ